MNNNYNPNFGQPTDVNQPLMQNQFAPENPPMHNQFPPQINQPINYPPQQVMIQPQPNAFIHNQNPPMMNNTPGVIYVNPTQPAKQGFQMHYNLPENPMELDCAYCNRRVTTKLDYRYNLCCLIFFFIYVISVFYIFVEPLFVFGWVFWTCLFGISTYLSRVYKHLCTQCGREIGRGVPTQGCCSASFD